MNRSSLIATALSLALLASPSHAQDASLLSALEKVGSALAKGHGAMCSLSMEPVETGGYYRCLDIGPYRFVEEYGRTRAFVVVESQPPFEIAASTLTGVHFTHQGPWTSDLAGRVLQWYAYEVEGGRAVEQAFMDEQGRVQSARDAVGAYLESLEPAEPTIQPPPPTPIAPPVHPVATPSPVETIPSDQIPVTGVPFPQITAPEGGVVVAPGVVAYPQGAPQF